MTKVNNIQDIVANFVFKKGDYLGAEEQLSRFAESYAKLSADEAESLRNKFQAKDRLGWLRIASTLFCKLFSDADTLHKDKLCKIFFALYSFENLDFGFDGVNDVISVSDKLKGHPELARKNWDLFSKLTSNGVARNNLENKIFLCQQCL
jgi:hypothetical protein